MQPHITTANTNRDVGMSYRADTTQRSLDTRSRRGVTSEHSTVGDQSPPPRRPEAPWIRFRPALSEHGRKSLNNSTGDSRRQQDAIRGNMRLSEIRTPVAILT